MVPVQAVQLGELRIDLNHHTLVGGNVMAVEVLAHEQDQPVDVGTVVFDTKAMAGDRRLYRDDPRLGPQQLDRVVEAKRAVRSGDGDLGGDRSSWAPHRHSLPAFLAPRYRLGRATRL
jgi:hypothetical protein